MMKYVKMIEKQLGKYEALPNPNEYFVFRSKTFQMKKSILIERFDNSSERMTTNCS